MKSQRPRRRGAERPGHAGRGPAARSSTGPAPGRPRGAANSAGLRPSRPRPPAETSWDHVAQWYDRLVGDEGSDYHQQVILPAALRLLDVQPGQRVLDLCCGQGVLARQLAQRGAAFVLGVDASPQLIAAARERGAGPNAGVGPRVGGGPGAERSAGLRFEVADATRPGAAWADGSFDRVACVMAAHDVADFAALARTAAGALRPGGRFVLVLMHPCFRVPRQSGWGWDEAKRTQYRRVDRYATRLEVPIHTRPGQNPGEQTLFFHRPLAVYINALGAAGLGLTAAEEPLSHRRAAPGGHSRGENRAAEEIPVFLALAAVRLPGG